MIRIERVALPEGLRAVAHRDPDGDLIVYVSNALDAKRQRAAVMQALRASRRTGWRAGLPPVGLALLVPLRLWLRRAATAIRARPAAWAAATTAVVAGAAAAGIFLGNAPHGHGSSASARPPAAGISRPPQPRRQRPAAASRGRQVQPVGAISPVSPSAPGRQPQPSAAFPAPGRPSSAPSPARSVGSPPAPGPSPSPSQSPAPSSSSTGGKQQSCVIILQLRVCLPAISLSVTA